MMVDVFNNNSSLTATGHGFNQHDIRQAYIQFVDQLNPVFAITFNFNRNVGLDYAIQTLREFERRLNRILLGHDAHKDKANQPIWIHFIENEDSNTHFHSVVRILPNYQRPFIKSANHIWAKLANTSSCKGQLYVDVYNERCAVYNTKGMTLIDTAA